MGRNSKVLGLDGRAVRRCGKTLEELVEATRRAHPELSAAAVQWQAERTFERLDAIHDAIEAGLEQSVGRELRQRWEHGLGVEIEERPGMAPEMAAFVAAMRALAPEERGAALAILRTEIGA